MQTLSNTTTHKMSEQNQKLWVKLRAEIIQRFHEKENPGLFKNNFPIEYAKQIARKRLEHSLKTGKWEITLEQMLLHTDDECNEIMLENYTESIKLCNLV